MNTFTTDMAILRRIYDINPDKLPKLFWDYIDSVPEQVVFYWTERLLNAQGLLLGHDFMKVSDINFWYRQKKFYTETQQRYLMIELIKNWYDLEIRYEIL